MIESLFPTPLPLLRWGVRCGALLGASLVLAVVYAGVKPMPPGAFASYGKSKAPAEHTDTPPPGDGTAPAIEGPDAKGDVSNLAWFQAAAEDGSHWVLDARSDRDFRAGHVPGAVHLDFAMFSRGVPDKLELLRGMPMVIYCSGGDCDASHKVKTMLQAYGFTDNIYVFVPGFPAWEQAGLPVEKGDSAF